MKRVVSALTIVCLLFSLCTITVMADDPTITVYLDGQQIIFDTDPMMVNDRTFVPLRAIAEALGCEVGWTEETQEVLFTKGDIQNKLYIGNTVATCVNGEQIKSVILDAAPFTNNDRTYVPLRYLAESLNINVEWDETTWTVIMTSKSFAPPAVSPEPSGSPSATEPTEPNMTAKPIDIKDIEDEAEEYNIKSYSNYIFSNIMLADSLKNLGGKEFYKLSNSYASLEMYIIGDWTYSACIAIADKTNYDMNKIKSQSDFNKFFDEMSPLQNEYGLRYSDAVKKLIVNKDDSKYPIILIEMNDDFYTEIGLAKYIGIELTSSGKYNYYIMERTLADMFALTQIDPTRDKDNYKLVGLSDKGSEEDFLDGIKEIRESK